MLTGAFFLNVQYGSAQNQPWAGFAIEGNFIVGKVIKHSPKFKLPIPDVSTAFDINFVQQTWGKKNWQQRRHFPVVGFGIAYTNYGVDSIYGRAIGLYPNLQIPIITGQHIEWTFRVGFGGAYISKHFERAPSWDTLNTAIGSHFNNFSIFATDLRYRVNTHCDVQIGGSFTHISNAAVKKPNLGINMYGAHIGLRYFPVTSKPEKKYKQLMRLKKRWLLNARLGLSFNEDGYADGPIYPVYMASLYASKRWLSKNKIFAGVDYSYHKRTEAFLKNNEIYPGHEMEHSYKSALFLGNEFLYGRVGILFQLGYYLHKDVYGGDNYYEKLGCNLYLVQKEKGILKELAAGVFLKTHKTQAELVEFGLGVGF